MEEIKISNRQIALMAFDRLRKEDKTDSALKLARCMLHGTSISLGIGDIDWGDRQGNTAVRRSAKNRIQIHGLFPLQPEYGNGKGNI